MVKNPPANAWTTGDAGLIPGSGRSPGGRNGNLLQYSCLGNPMDRGYWQATIHGVTKRQVQLRMHALPLHNLELYLDWHHTSESMGLRFDYVCSGTCNLYLEKWKKVKVKLLSHVWLFATPWTVAYQGPQFVEFSRQEYWSGLPFPSPGDLPNPDPGIRPVSPALAGRRCRQTLYHLSHQGSPACNLRAGQN